MSWVQLDYDIKQGIANVGRAALSIADDIHDYLKWRRQYEEECLKELKLRGERL